MLTEPLRRMADTARGYDRTKFGGDLVAGLTVACVGVPQSVAYAVIAGVPPEYGIYTLIFQSLVGALFSSHPLLSVGPMITQSLLVASTVTHAMGAMGQIDPSQAPALYLELVIALTLLKGILQTGFAMAHLGALVQYVSNSVIVGFTAGAGVLIAAGQVHSFLGFATQRGADDWPGVIGEVQRLWPHLREVSLPAVAIGVAALAIVLLARRISKFIPGPLLAIVLAAVAVGLFGLTRDDLTLVGAIPQQLPSPMLPNLTLARVETLLAGAIALSLLGLLEAYSIAKTLAARTGTTINATHELFSQGVTNAATSFFSCIPGSGSFSRSALNYYAGAKTCFSGIFNGLFVAIIFLVAAPWAKLIPMSALAAILFVIAVQLIDWRAFVRMARASRPDAIVCAITFSSTLLLPLAYAIYVGIFLNLALYLRRTSQIHMAEMVQAPSGPFIERPIETRRGDRKVMFISIEGDLFFGLADQLESRLHAIADSGVRVVIIRLKRTLSVDATILSVFERFCLEMQSHGGHVILCGLKPELLETVRAYGLAKVIGEDNLFETGFGVFTSAKRALTRARQLVGESIDLDDFEDDATEGWAYEI